MIGSMMSKISIEPKLSRVYTNHSLRATTITMLANGGQEGRYIVKVTQHKSVNSLKSYCRLSDSKRKTMSSILSYGLEGNDPGTYDQNEKATMVQKTTKVLYLMQTPIIVNFLCQRSLLLVIPLIFPRVQPM